ncbi:MAG: Clp protease N-terminal domain-containing protein [Rhodanobacteraceae bacterium]
MIHRPLTTRAQHALSFADSAAASLSDDFVGTEHLLLGLLEERAGPAAQMLASLGVTSERVSELVRQTRSSAPDP